MKIKIIFFTLLLIATIPIFSQTESDAEIACKKIKSNPQQYMWGEGAGASYQLAKSNALQILSSQISVQMESSFEQKVDQFKNAEGSTQFKQTISSKAKSYSNVILNNVEELILSKDDETEFKIFVFIKRANIKKMFDDRLNKIKSNIKLALEAENRLQISDELRLLYWSLLLLKSHPDGNSTFYIPDINKPNDSVNLIVWLPEKINHIFANLKVSANKIEEEGLSNIKTVTMYATYKNKPVTNLDYSFFNGSKYEESNGCKDGYGLLEFYGKSSIQIKKYVIQIEYEFKSQAIIDKDIDNVIKESPAINFKNRIELGLATITPLENTNLTANLTPPINSVQITAPVFLEKKLNPMLDSIQQKNEMVNEQVQTISKEDSTTFQYKITQIAKAIQTKNYKNLEKYFSEEGYEIFKKIIVYGNTKLVGNEHLTFEHFEDKIFIRPLKLQFSFQTNNKKFVEDLVFSYDTATGKIDNINFGLNKITLQSIEDHNEWTNHDKKLLTHTMESYKTAYSLKRIDYLKSIFSEDAIIIVGKKIRTEKSKQYNNKPKIILNKYDK
ncbi:MAG: hypothetical protein ORN58_05745, partial [Sediminibacterium sp.]|nr:hypothetical protein [Sediminibacterium sp.]